jgi:hypothetical protein
MKKMLLSALLVLVPLCVASFSSGQEVNDQACTDKIQTSCTKCHGTGKICDDLGKADTNWPKIMEKMSKKAKLSQEEHDMILNCLTKSADPKKVACP